MPYIITFLVSTAACFGLQALALRASGGRFAKNESNYFSSIGRIQAGTVGKPEVMLLGSSITGRLPDRADGFEGFANMGCDGGSALDALRAMDAGILSAAPQLVIEANTLQLALDKKPTEVGQAMRRPWFAVGLEVPVLASYARPSAFFYSKLLALKIGGFDASANDDLGVSTRPMLIQETSSVPLTERQNELIDEIVGILGRLRSKGSQVLLVWLPPGRSDNSSPPAWILEIARRGVVPYWDLGQDAAPGSVTLTDGVHMASPSAARTIVSLHKVLDRH